MVARSSRSPSWWARTSEYREGRRVRHGARRAAARRGSSTTRRSPTTTRSSRPAPSTTSSKMGSDDRRIYDMVARRFLAVFHPRRCSRTRAWRRPCAADADGRMAATCSARAASCCWCPGWRGVYDEVAADARADARRARGGRGRRPAAAAPARRASRCETREIESARKETKPPRRYSDASLLGRDGDGGQARRRRRAARGDEGLGIGTPATRAAIIERLITVGYVERDGRALVATEKGLNVIRLLDEHALTSPGLTGSWEQRLGKIERGEDSRKKFMSDIAGFAAGDRARSSTRRSKTCASRAPRLGPVPGVRARDRREPQGLLVLGARGSRLRLRDLEGESRQAAAAGGRARADQDRLHRAGR